MRNIVKFGLTLFLICVIAAGLLAFINKLTTPKIIAQNKQEEMNSLKEVMPNMVSFSEVKKDGKTIYFKALDKDNKIIGLCFLAKKYGYSSEIVTMVGITAEGEITGIKILNQNETPGLGAKIIEVEQTKTIWDIFKKDTSPEEKINPWFQEEFKAKNISDLKVDTITGATISSKAVIDSIKEKAAQVLEGLKNAR